MVYFQGTRRSREPFLNAPASVLWLIGVIAAAHVARVALPGDWPERIVADYALVPLRYAETFAQGASVQTVLALLVPLVSYIFLHADFVHLGINSLWLLAFGPMVVRRLRPLRFLVFFFACGVAAALVHLAVYWTSPVPVVGASGSISGLMAAGMRILYGAIYGGAGPRGAALAPIFCRPILFFSAMWVVGNIVTGVVGIGLTNDMTVIAWVAHLGGYFAGLALIGPMDRLAWRANQL